MMKRFKFRLVGIILSSLFITCFSSAETIVVNVEPCVLYTGTVVGRSTIEFSNSSFNGLILMGTYNADGGYSESSALWNYYGSDGTNTSIDTYESNVNYNYYGMVLPTTGCNFSSNSGCGECEDCPVIDTNYCVENDLCPVPSNNSVLYINEIEHESAPVIDITIPQEYDWNSSINSGVFDLTISGYNVDYDYIDNIIRTQQSKPNATDFNNIVSGLIPLLIPGLVILLFIWFIFKFIKKIF